MNAGDLDLKIKSYKNKSRKGKYVLLRQKIGKKWKRGTYKLSKREGLDEQLLVFSRMFKDKSRSRKKAREMIREKKVMSRFKRPTIEHLLGRGLVTIQGVDLKGLDYSKERNIYRHIVRKLGLQDKQLVDIITERENVKKYKHRISLSAMVFSNDGRKLVGFGDAIGRGDLLEFRESILSGVKGGGIRRGHLIKLSENKGIGFKIYDSNLYNQVVGEIKLRVIFSKER